MCPWNTYESVVERVTKVIMHHFFFIRIIPSVESVFIFRYLWKVFSAFIFLFSQTQKNIFFCFSHPYVTYQETVLNIKWKITLEVSIPVPDIVWGSTHSQSLLYTVCTKGHHHFSVKPQALQLAANDFRALTLNILKPELMPYFFIAMYFVNRKCR